MTEPPSQPEVQSSREPEDLHSAGWYRLLIEHGASVYAVLDKDGKVLYESPSLEQVYGWTPEELVGRSIFDLVHPQDIPDAVKAFKELLLNPGLVKTIEVRYRHKRGDWLFIEVTGTSLLHDPAVGGVVLTSHDITDRRQALDALRESEERYRTIFDNIQDVYYEVLPEGTLVELSPTVSTISSYTREELLGRSMFEIYENPSDREAFTEALRVHGKVTDYEVRLKDSDNSLKICSLTAKLLFDAEGRPWKICGTLRDVTRRKEAEARQAELEEQLRQTEKIQAIGLLAGGIAHDFNNQLSSIMGHADLLLKKLEESPLSKYAKKIIRTASRTADLTAQLLAFARKGEFQSVPLNVHRIVAEVVALLTRSLDKRIQIHQDLTARPSWTLGDPAQLENALLNLGINARDAMPTGGELTFSTSVLGPDEERPPTLPGSMTGRPVLRIDVCDTGIGMDRETRRQIFDPFFTTKMLGEGTGLGLSAAHGTIEAHGGLVTVQSQPALGSTFSVFLPSIVQPSPQALPAPPPVESGEKVHVLVLDDEDAVLDMATEMLESLSYSVTSFTDPAAAIAHYARAWREINVVLLDMMMPEMDGREVFQAMREVNPAIRAVLFSGYSLVAHSKEILGEGILTILKKPFLASALSQKIQEALTFAPGGNPADS